MLIFKNQIEKCVSRISPFRQGQGRARGSGFKLLRFRGGASFFKYKPILFNFPLIFDKLQIIKILPDYGFRTAFIAQVVLSFKMFFKKYYIIIHKDAKIGDFFFNLCNFNLNFLSWDFFKMRCGDLYCLKNLPVGATIYNLEKKLGRGGCYIRSAGCFGVIVRHDLIAKITTIKLPSKQLIHMSFLNRANLGIVSNVNFRFVHYKRAGALRHLGFKSHVRGVAMNSKDHPHGGGRGKTKGGRPSVSIWGWLTKGKKTVY